MRLKNVWLFSLANLCYSGSLNAFSGYLPLYLRSIDWLPASADGALAAMSGAGMIAVVPFSILSGRLGLRKGFIIPAPLKRKDITYVAADISIELTTEKAVTLIKDYAPFYRNIIYDVIGDALKALDKSKISEISLKISILKALNSTVPERSVKNVIVDTFVMF